MTDFDATNPDMANPDAANPDMADFGMANLGTPDFGMVDLGMVDLGMVDLIVVGGGPAGLAVAVWAVLAGLSAVVVEPRPGPIDKACGEGLMPSGVAALAALGVTAEGWPLRGIRYLDARHDVAAAFPDGREGLGVRRTTLHAALARRARELGVPVLRSRITAVQQASDHVRARCSQEPARYSQEPDRNGDQELRRDGQELGQNSREPTWEGHELTRDGQKPTRDGQEPTRGREPGWDQGHTRGQESGRGQGHTRGQESGRGRGQESGRWLRGRWLVGADGLHSTIREISGLAGPPAPIRRYGLRRHYPIPPWTDHVEVHWSPAGEAYVTPVGPNLVGVAVLTSRRGSYPEQLAAFPTLAPRLSAPAITRARGAGPLRQRAKALRAGRVLLVGDAAGYMDALTGEGVSLALRSAELLIRCLTENRPEAYEPEWRRLTRRHRMLTGALLAATNRPPTARLIVPAARRLPAVFGAAVALLA